MSQRMKLAMAGLGAAIVVVLLALLLFQDWSPPAGLLRTVRIVEREPSDVAAASEESTEPDAAGSSVRTTTPRESEAVSGSVVTSPSRADPEPMRPSTAARNAVAGNTVDSWLASGTRAGYLPGNVATWTSSRITVGGPLTIRAAGLISTNERSAGPEGLFGVVSTAVGPGVDGPTIDALRLPTAPYLSLIGKICGGGVCGEPFLLGADTTICPTREEIGGELQMLTNNHLELAGLRTFGAYSATTGGFSVHAEPVPQAVCLSGQPATGLTSEARVLESGDVLRQADFHVSASQTFWKPVFVSLEAPLVVRATGEIRPSGTSPSTGPNGLIVPGEALFLPSAPFHALIGRLCGPDDCKEPFVVGRERTVCPSPPHTDRLELWVNRVVPGSRMLDRQTPVTYEMFELQAQSGGYQFELARAPAGACVADRR